MFQNTQRYMKILKIIGMQIFKIFIYLCVYEDFKNLHSDDFLQLITEAETQEEKNFFETVWNYLLQEKQKKVIERNLF